MHACDYAIHLIINISTRVQSPWTLSSMLGTLGSRVLASQEQEAANAKHR